MLRSSLLSLSFSSLRRGERVEKVVIEKVVFETFHARSIKKSSFRVADTASKWSSSSLNRTHPSFQTIFQFLYRRRYFSPPPPTRSLYLTRAKVFAVHEYGTNMESLSSPPFRSHPLVNYSFPLILFFSHFSTNRHSSLPLLFLTLEDRNRSFRYDIRSHSFIRVSFLLSLLSNCLSFR